MSSLAYCGKVFSFQSTPPVKAATSSAAGSVPPYTFQSTPPVKAATISAKLRRIRSRISIHAAREGGDSLTESNEVKAECISIHAAREGGDTASLYCPLCSTNFNPRRP